MNMRRDQQYHRRYAHRLRRLSIREELFERLEDICCNCTNLEVLEIGESSYELNPDGSAWPSARSAADHIESTLRESGDDEDEGREEEEAEEEEEKFELDVKLIAQNLPQLKRLIIGSGLQLKRPSAAPPVLPQLIYLEELKLCPLGARIKCDETRDERNLRILAQSSTQLRILDLRGCYLKIFSLGWLKTDSLEALHLFFQVPAASVFFKLSRGLKYLTLSMICERTRRHRSQGPVEPGEELDACLAVLAHVGSSPLTQLDLRGSDCSLGAVESVVRACIGLTYLDTRGCDKLDEGLRVQCVSSEQIRDSFRLREDSAGASVREPAVSSATSR